MTTPLTTPLTTRRRPTSRASVAALASLALVAVACGDDQDDAADPAPVEEPAANVDESADESADDGAGAATEATTDAAATADESTADEGDVVEVVLRDFAFEGLPEELDAGTRLTVVNRSSVELHELVAYRLADDETRSVEELVALPAEELHGTLGQPVTVLLAEPGGGTIPAVGDGTLAEPGRYAILCFIPTGADPAEYLAAAAEATDGPPQVDGGAPHAVHGMHAEVVVR